MLTNTFIKWIGNLSIFIAGTSIVGVVVSKTEWFKNTLSSEPSLEDSENTEDSTLLKLKKKSTSFIRSAIEGFKDWYNPTAHTDEAKETSSLPDNPSLSDEFESHINPTEPLTNQEEPTALPLPPIIEAATLDIEAPITEPTSNPDTTIKELDHITDQPNKQNPIPHIGPKDLYEPPENIIKEVAEAAKRHSDSQSSIDKSKSISPQTKQAAKPLYVESVLIDGETIKTNTDTDGFRYTNYDVGAIYNSERNSWDILDSMFSKSSIPNTQPTSSTLNPSSLSIATTQIENILKLKEDLSSSKRLSRAINISKPSTNIIYAYSYPTKTSRTQEDQEINIGLNKNYKCRYSTTTDRNCIIQKIIQTKPSFFVNFPSFSTLPTTAEINKEDFTKPGLNLFKIKVSDELLTEINNNTSEDLRIISDNKNSYGTLKTIFAIKDGKYIGKTNYLLGKLTKIDQTSETSTIKDKKVSCSFNKDTKDMNGCELIEWTPNIKQLPTPIQNPDELKINQQYIIKKTDETLLNRSTDLFSYTFTTQSEVKELNKDLLFTEIMPIFVFENKDKLSPTENVGKDI